MGDSFTWRNKYPLFVGLAFVASVALGCERKQASVQQKPSWFYDTRISAKEAKPAFDDNSEVFVEIMNKTDAPVVIRGLDRDGAITLVRASGKESKPHRVSVGVAKPITVPPRGTRRASLLFEANIGAPKQLRIYGQDHAIPEN